MHDAHVHAIEEIGGRCTECLARHAGLVGIARSCTKKKTTVTRFELVRAEPNHLAGGHLNHSAKLSLTLIVIAEWSQSSAKPKNCTRMNMDVTEDIAGFDEASCASLDEVP